MNDQQNDKSSNEQNTTSLKDGVFLLFLNSWIGLKNFVDFAKVVKNYYKNPLFRSADLKLLRYYLFQNPYKISKSFLQKRGETDIYAYGETPLTTLEYIVSQCGITKEDVVFELGCGRGRTCFWLRCVWGCRVMGIDFVPEFIGYANKVKESLHLSGIEFREGHLEEVDFQKAAVVYLYGTCLDEATIHVLLHQLKNTAQKGAKVITVSFSLLEYGGEDAFALVKSFPATFTWGTTEVFLQVKVG